MKKLSYITFLNFHMSLKGGKYDLKVDAKAIKLLEYIAVQHSKGNSYTVSEAMKLNHLGSPATLHRKISDLIKENIIDVIYEGDNKIPKYLVPSRKANIYFSNLKVFSYWLALRQPLQDHQCSPVLL